MALTDLWLIRHGESVANVAATRAEREGRAAIDLDIRDADVPLSPVGEEQASALASWLERLDANVDAFWVSPYLRARQTLAGAVDRRVVSTPIVDERLRDRELGILDLLTRAGVAAQHPEEEQRRRRLGKYYHRPPGGESWADVALRLRSFLQDALPSAHSTGVIVAHDAVVMILVALLLEWDEETLLEFASDHTVLNASVTHLAQMPDGWRLRTFADVTHLRRDGAPVTVHPGSPDVEPE